VKLPFRRRRRWDEQPTDPVGVLLASDGSADFTSRAVAETVSIARDRGATTAAVVTIAKVHGTSLGLPHPGLMPTKAELKERVTWVNNAARDLKRQGLEADGQVASTRNPAKVIVNVARLRGASTIVVDRSPRSGWRRVIEGDLVHAITRRAKSAGITVVDGNA
jgi:nucleotide-binding universal stress UspA family protein